MEIVSYLVENHIIRFVDDKLQFLLLKRAPDNSYPYIWQMITGSIENNEKASQTAVREMFEETSLKPDKMWVVPNVNSFYDDSKDVICLVPVFVSLISENQSIVISDEHSEFRWVEKDEAVQLLAWQGQRKSVEIIFDFFTNKKSTYKFIELEKI